MENEKLYIVTRADLPPGAVAAQSVHTALTFAHAHPSLETAWFYGANNIVLLSVPNEEALAALAALAEASDVPHAPFHEPDFGGSLTGVALAGAGRRLVQKLPLALRRAETSACAASLPASPETSLLPAPAT